MKDFEDSLILSSRRRRRIEGRAAAPAQLAVPVDASPLARVTIGAL